MNEDFIQELQRFQQYASSMQKLMSDMQDRMPQRVEGSDSQGAITVRMGSDGLPESIKAASDWHRRQAPEAIGGAVIEAYGSAMSQHMEGWSQAFEEGDWQAKADQLDGGSSGQPAAADPPLTQPEPPEIDLRYVIPRGLDEVTEDVLSVFDAVERLEVTASEPAQATGTSTARRVALTVTKSALLSCEVDPQWATRQSSIGMNQAFEEALADARAKLSSIEAAAEDSVADLQLDGLLNEILAILQNPQRFTN
ncbi:hypothetical protein ACFRQM_00710 [Streptomyces sp. NPDC056831]|uniref:hypothetical protein n=1 Tax=Streptomyces sp. NPDC056831 TaxID=3345954 RepID=UPI003691F5B5